MHCIASKFSNHFPRRVGWRGAKHTPGRCAQPFFWHVDFAAVRATDPSDKNRVGLLRLRDILTGGGAIRGLVCRGTTTSFRGLLLEESIDCVHLVLMVSRSPSITNFTRIPFPLRCAFRSGSSVAEPSLHVAFDALPLSSAS